MQCPCNDTRLSFVTPNVCIFIQNIDQGHVLLGSLWGWGLRLWWRPLPGPISELVSSWAWLTNAQDKEIDPQSTFLIVFVDKLISVVKIFYFFGGWNLRLTSLVSCCFYPHQLFCQDPPPLIIHISASIRIHRNYCTSLERKFKLILIKFMICFIFKYLKYHEKK